MLANNPMISDYPNGGFWLVKSNNGHCLSGWQQKDGFTLDLSSSLVIMTTTALLCSQIILQNSPNVSGKGPCVAM